MKMILVSVCVSIRPNIAREIIQNRVAEVNFQIFTITSPVGVQF